MVLLPRWKIIVILLVSFLGLAYAAPNILGAETLSAWQKTVPSWLPGKTINLGLDLRGGSHLLLKVDLVEVTRSRARGLSQAIRQEARDALKENGWS